MVLGETVNHLKSTGYNDKRLVVFKFHIVYINCISSYIYSIHLLITIFNLDHEYFSTSFYVDMLSFPRVNT